MVDYRAERKRLNDESNERIRCMQTNIDKVVAVGKMYNTDVVPLVAALQKEVNDYKGLVTNAMGSSFVCEIVSQSAQVAFAVSEADVFGKRAIYHYLKDSVAIMKMCGEIE